ncbi:MAG: DUF1778 domain-containing protein [Planctomycetia bacterium]
MASTPVRSEKIDLRVSPEAKRTLQAAAAAQDRSLSEFVVESALGRAAETLPDRQWFGLDEGRWKAFLAALEKPVTSRPRLRKLLRSDGPFDSGS